MNDLPFFVWYDECRVWHNRMKQCVASSLPSCLGTSDPASVLGASLLDCGFFLLPLKVEDTISINSKNERFGADFV